MSSSTSPHLPSKRALSPTLSSGVEVEGALVGKKFKLSPVPPPKQEESEGEKTTTTPSSTKATEENERAVNGYGDGTRAIVDAQYRLPLKKGEVYYIDNFVDGEKAWSWYEGLKILPGWYQPKLKMYGKEITQSRRIAAYARDPATSVKYSGQTVDMQYDYPELLDEIQDMLEKKLGVKFTYVMCNWYEEGSVYIGPHRDNKDNAIIASLSLGTARTFIMKYAPPAIPKPRVNAKTKISAVSTYLEELSKEDHSEEKVELLEQKKWMLSNGSLVVMQGETQKYWKHEIPREPKIKDGRISLTFRQLV